MDRSTLYLSSLDSTRLEQPRTCVLHTEVVLDSGRKGLLATVTPPVAGQDFGVPDDIAEVLIANRHEGESIEDIVDFPFFVYVARLRKAPRAGEVIRVADLEIIGWGELYRTRKDAEEHVFDNHQRGG